jgi:VanZ family protein
VRRRAGSPREHLAWGAFDGALNQNVLTHNDLKSGVKPPHSKNRLLRYGPVVLWAALIFIGSSDLLSASKTSSLLARLLPSVSESALGIIQFVVRKGGHFLEYAVLALLAARAFRTSSRELLGARWFWMSLLLVVVYSLSDEFHQSFVSSRTASIYDCLIDTAGGLAALILVAIRSRVSTGSGSDRIKQSS